MSDSGMTSEQHQERADTARAESSASKEPSIAKMASASARAIASETPLVTPLETPTPVQDSAMDIVATNITAMGRAGTSPSRPSSAVYPQSPSRFPAAQSRPVGQHPAEEQDEEDDSVVDDDERQHSATIQRRRWPTARANARRHGQGRPQPSIRGATTASASSDAAFRAAGTSRHSPTSSAASSTPPASPSDSSSPSLLPTPLPSSTSPSSISGHPRQSSPPLAPPRQSSPAQSSAHVLPQSHSYPFLADAPQRSYTRQFGQRRVSMPTHPRTASASASPSITASTSTSTTTARPRRQSKSGQSRRVSEAVGGAVRPSATRAAATAAAATNNQMGAAAPLRAVSAGHLVIDADMDSTEQDRGQYLGAHDSSGSIVTTNTTSTNNKQRRKRRRTEGEPSAVSGASQRSVTPSIPTLVTPSTPPVATAAAESSPERSDAELLSQHKSILPAEEGASGHSSPMSHPDRRYELLVVQEPLTGCAFGKNILSRIPCAPPLILRLRVVDASTGRVMASDVEEPWLFCNVNLLTEYEQPADMISPIASPKETPVKSTHDEPAADMDVEAGPSSLISAATAGDAKATGAAPQSDPSASSSSELPVRRSARRIARSSLGDSSTSSARQRSSASAKAAAIGTSAESGKTDPTAASSKGKGAGKQKGKEVNVGSTTIASSGPSASETAAAAEPDTSLASTSASAAANTSASSANVSTTSSQQSVPNHPVRMLYGSLVANPQVFASREGPMATFFLFPELCVRARGRFRLRATLMRLPRSGFAANMEAPAPPSTSSAPGGSALATVTTNVFTVQLASDYVAPYVTDTTKFFARQGAALPLPAGELSSD